MPDGRGEAGMHCRMRTATPVVRPPSRLNHPGSNGVLMDAMVSDFGQRLVGLFRSVEPGFELCRRCVVKVAVEPLVLCPVHPAQGGQFDIGDSAPRFWPGGFVDQFGLVVAVDDLRRAVTEAVTDGVD